MAEDILFGPGDQFGAIQAGAELQTNKGAPSGYAGLDANGRLVANGPVAYGTLAQRNALTIGALPDGFPFFATDDNGGTLYQAQSSAWVVVTRPTGAAIEYRAGDPFGRSSYVPTFTKSAANPFMTIANQPLTSMERVSTLYVGDIFGGAGPYGELWRVYYSTDHAGAATTAGIGLLTCASSNPETGSWVARGLVFRDTTGGSSNQTEYPTVVYVPDAPGGAAFYMYYHRGSDPNATSTQALKLATMTVAQSLISESWTIHPTNSGIVGDQSYPGWPAVTTYGYFQPQRIGNDWFAYCLSTGLPVPKFSLLRSPTGLPGSWALDPRPLIQNAAVMADPNGRFNQSSHYPAWDACTIFRWKGQLWWLGIVFSYAGGGGFSTFSFYGLAPLSDDYRRLLSTPTLVFTSNQGWEAATAGAPAGMADYRSGGSLVIGPDNKLRLFYQAAGAADVGDGTTKAASGAFGIAVAA